MSLVETNEYVKVPIREYMVLKKIYNLNKKQQELTRIYEVEENLKNGNYKSMDANDFINSI